MLKKIIGLLAALTQRKMEIKAIPDYEYRPVQWEQLTLDLEFEPKKLPLEKG